MPEDQININDKATNFFKKLFLIIFIYVIIEGAVRKWFVYGYDTEIILIRDALVIYSIFYGYYNNIYRNDWKESLLLIWSFLVISWCIIQFIDSNFNPFVSLVGIRNWVMYFWFSLLCLRCLRKKEIEEISLIILYTIVPIGILVVYQHFSPAEHIINKQVGEFDEMGNVFMLALGIVRTTGTFSFTYGQSQYLAFLTPFIFLLMDGGYKNSISQINKIMITTFFFIAVMVSGSRAAILFAGFMLIIFFMISIRLNKMTKILFYLLSAILFALLTLYFFGGAIDATVARFEIAGGRIDFRIMQIIFGSENTWSNFNFFGEGIGLGSNLSRPYTETPFLLGENESDRILNEGGLVGFMFFLLKFIFSIIILFRGYKISKDSNNILPFTYCVYMAVQLLMAQITGQLTTHAFTFLGLGILFVILNTYGNLNSRVNENNIKTTI